MSKPRDTIFDEKQQRLFEEREEFKIKPFKPKFVPPEVLEIKFSIVQMPYLGTVFKCEECSCILVSEEDMKRHLEYERNKLKKYNVIMKYKLISENENTKKPKGLKPPTPL